MNLQQIEKGKLFSVLQNGAFRHLKEFYSKTVSSRVRPIQIAK